MPQNRASPTAGPPSTVTEPDKLPVAKTGDGTASEEASGNCSDSTESELTPSTVIIVKEKTATNAVSENGGQCKPLDKPAVTEKENSVDNITASSQSRVNDSNASVTDEKEGAETKNGKADDSVNSAAPNEPVDLSVASRNVTEAAQSGNSQPAKTKTPSPTPQSTAQHRESSPLAETIKVPKYTPVLSSKPVAQTTDSPPQKSLFAVIEGSAKPPTGTDAEGSAPRKVSPSPKRFETTVQPKKAATGLGRLENVIERIKPASMPVNNEHSVDLSRVSPRQQNEKVVPFRKVSPSPERTENNKKHSILTKVSPGREIHEKGNNEPTGKGVPPASENTGVKHTKSKPGLENIVAKLGKAPFASEGGTTKTVAVSSVAESTAKTAQPEKASKETSAKATEVSVRTTDPKDKPSSDTSSAFSAGSSKPPVVQAKEDHVKSVENSSVQKPVEMRRDVLETTENKSSENEEGTNKQDKNVQKSVSTREKTKEGKEESRALEDAQVKRTPSPEKADKSDNSQNENREEGAAETTEEKGKENTDKEKGNEIKESLSAPESKEPSTLEVSAPEGKNLENEAEVKVDPGLKQKERQSQSEKNELPAEKATVGLVSQKSSAEQKTKESDPTEKAKAHLESRAKSQEKLDTLKEKSVPRELQNKETETKTDSEQTPKSTNAVSEPENKEEEKSGDGKNVATEQETKTKVGRTQDTSKPEKAKAVGQEKENTKSTKNEAVVDPRTDDTEAADNEGKERTNDKKKAVPESGKSKESETATKISAKEKRADAKDKKDEKIASDAAKVKEAKKTSAAPENATKVAKKPRKTSPKPEEAAKKVVASAGKSTKAREESPILANEEKETETKTEKTEELKSDVEKVDIPPTSKDVSSKKNESKPATPIPGDTANVCKIVTVNVLSSPETLAKVVKSSKATASAVGKEKAKKGPAEGKEKVTKAKKSGDVTEKKPKGPRGKKSSPAPDGPEDGAKSKKSDDAEDKAEKITKKKASSAPDGASKEDKNAVPEKEETETGEEKDGSVADESTQKPAKPKKAAPPSKRKANVEKDGSEAPVQKKKRITKKALKEAQENKAKEEDQKNEAVAIADEEPKEEASAPAEEVKEKPVKKKRAPAKKKAAEAKSQESESKEMPPEKEENKDVKESNTAQQTAIAQNEPQAKPVKAKKAKAAKALDTDSSTTKEAALPKKGKKSAVTGATKKKKKGEVNESDPEFLLEEETTDSDASVRPRPGERHSERQSKKQSPSPRRGRSKSPRSTEEGETTVTEETEPEEVVPPPKKGKKAPKKKDAAESATKDDTAQGDGKSVTKGSATVKKKRAKKKSPEVFSSDTEVEEPHGAGDNQGQEQEAQNKTDISQKGRKRTPKPMPEDEISPEVKKKKRTYKRKAKEEEISYGMQSVIDIIEAVSKDTTAAVTTVAKGGKSKVPKSKTSKKAAKKLNVAQDSTSAETESKDATVTETDAQAAVDNTQEGLPGAQESEQTIPAKQTAPSGGAAQPVGPLASFSDSADKPSSNQGSVTESQIDYSERIEDQDDDDLLLSARIPIVYTGTAPKTPPPTAPLQPRGEDVKVPPYGGTMPSPHRAPSDLPPQQTAAETGAALTSPPAAHLDGGDRDSNNSSDTIDYNLSEEGPPARLPGSGSATDVFAEDHDPDARASLEQLGELTDVSKPRKKRKANRIFQCNQCPFIVSFVCFASGTQNQIEQSQKEYLCRSRGAVEQHPQSKAGWWCLSSLVW